MNRRTETEIAEELARVERVEDGLDNEEDYADGLKGALQALRERLTPGQVTTIARREGFNVEELKAATVAADWMAGLSEERPSALFAV